MKRIFIFSILFVVVLFAISGCKKKVQIESDIISFEYNYGSYNGGYYDYKISVNDDIASFAAKGSNGVNLDIDKEIDMSYLVSLSNIINDNKIYEWNGFNKHDNLVMDGYSFELNIIYASGEEINASGYMVYPENYDAVHKKLTNFLSSIN